MTAGSVAALTIVYFVTSLVTVVTGSTSLITIPVMLQFGIEPRTAVATNMLALALLSFGGFLPFLNTPAIDRQRSPPLIGITLVGSGIGAFLLFAVPARWMHLVVPCAMIAVLLLLILQPEESTAIQPSEPRTRAGYVSAALLSVYGGFLSGGYATLITASGVLFFRYPLLRAIAMSRLLNTASSVIAVAVFAWYGIIDWRLGAALSAVAFAGGWLGSRLSQKMPALLLRRFFLIAVATLALKSLVYDVPWHDLP